MFLNTEYMIEQENKHGFTFNKLTKSCRNGRSLLPVEFLAFPFNPKLHF